MFRITNSSVKTLIVAVLCMLNTSPAAAGDFPGIGNAADWSEALPYYNRGNKRLNEQRWEEALDDYREAISKYPYDADFHSNLGICLNKLGDYKGEEEAFKAALKLKPKDWTSWSNLGNAYLKQDRMKDTISAFEQALKYNPPAADKAKIQQDLQDIHKLLRATGQEPLPTPPGTKIATKSKVAAKKPSTPPAPVPKPAPAKDWGYE